MVQVYSTYAILYSGIFIIAIVITFNIFYLYTKSFIQSRLNIMMMRYYILLPLLFVICKSSAQETKIKKEKWHWNKELKQDSVAGYCQVLKVDNILYISGAVTYYITPEGITSVYNDLKASLASYGATFENVVKENLYTTNIDSMKKFNNIRKKFYKNDFPAATWVQIQRLYMPKAKLEVELIAHLPK